MATKSNVHKRGAKAAALSSSRESIHEVPVPTDDELIASLAGVLDKVGEDEAYQLAEPQGFARFVEKLHTAGISVNAGGHLKWAIQTPSQPFSRS